MHLWFTIMRFVFWNESTSFSYQLLMAHYETQQWLMIWKKYGIIPKLMIKMNELMNKIKNE